MRPLQVRGLFALPVIPCLEMEESGVPPSQPTQKATDAFFRGFSLFPQLKPNVPAPPPPVPQKIKKRTKKDACSWGMSRCPSPTHLSGAARVRGSRCPRAPSAMRTAVGPSPTRPTSAMASHCPAGCSPARLQKTARCARWESCPVPVFLVVFLLFVGGPFCGFP